MKIFVSRAVLSFLAVAAVLSQEGFAQRANMTEAATKMFAVSAGYERFMGRWSRLLAPAYIAFAGVRNGDGVLDVGTGTGSLAAALEASMPASEIVGIDHLQNQRSRPTLPRRSVCDGNSPKRAW